MSFIPKIVPNIQAHDIPQSRLGMRLREVCFSVWFVFSYIKISGLKGKSTRGFPHVWMNHEILG